MFIWGCKGSPIKDMKKEWTQVVILFFIIANTRSQPLMGFVAKVCFPRDQFLLTVMAMTKLQNQIFTHANESVKK